MKKGVKIIIAILIAIILVLLGIFLIKIRKEEDAKYKTAMIYPIVVPIVTPKTGHITTTLEYLALVKNSKETLVNSKFAGKIKYIAKLGQKVKKGDIVVKIDPTPLKTKLKEINENINSIKNLIQADIVNLQTLKATHERTKKLLKVNMASIEQYDIEKAKIAALEAKLKADKNKLNTLYAMKNDILNDLSYAVIKSPVNGIVSAKFLNKGDNAFPGKPILKIAPNQGNYLFIPLADNYKEIIYKNKKYKLIPLHSTFNGVPVYKAEVHDKSLIPGEKIDIKVVTFDGNATLIPYKTLLTINGQNFVFDRYGHPIKVNILATGNQGVIVSNYLPQIIEADPDLLLKIKAGYPVKIKE